MVYFADDDNAYDIRLFDQYIRNIDKVGVWAVGMVFLLLRSHFMCYINHRLQTVIFCNVQ